MLENQDGDTVATGDALVLAPTEKLRMEAPDLPEVKITR